MVTKNIVFIAKSLDGYIADKNGNLDWLEMIPNPEHNSMNFNALMEEIDALVMGRNTFETVFGFGGPWPYPKPVFVLSNTMKMIPEELNKKVKLIKGDTQSILTQLHMLGCHKLYLDGGNVIQQFLKEDLIDELRITTVPILLGGGTPLFGNLPESIAFKHLKTEVFLGQLVQSWYQRKK